MQSICFFSSYYTTEQIPYYIKYYLEELQRHFTEVVFLTNEKTLSEEDHKYFKRRMIQYRLYKNEGYDFGMWYKAFQEFPVLNYDRIGLVNDSCVLFKKIDFIFQWINESNLDYCGITDSNAIAYHIQSYFVVINKNAIKPVCDYFSQHQIAGQMRDVIRKYEIGLSSYLLQRKMALGAYFSNKDYKGDHNPMLYFSDKLIALRLPLIKKKIIFCSFREEEFLSLRRMNFNIDPRFHINFIGKVNKGTEILDFDKITGELYDKKFISKIKFYKTKSSLFQFLRKFKFH